MSDQIDFKLDRLASPPRVSELLADELRTKILTHELSPGVALPNERDLAELSGVSRSSVRDALRLLEAEGLVETRIGRGGGTFVIRPDADTVIRSLEVFVLGRSVRLGDLLQVRALLEPACAEFAARNRTEADLERLTVVGQQLAEVVHVPERFLTLNVEWHVAVAEASHNELLAAIMTGISRLVRAGTETDRVVSAENFTIALKSHEKVLAAIQDQDPEAARRHMSRHVGGYADQLKNHVDDPINHDSSLEETDG